MIVLVALLTALSARAQQPAAPTPDIHYVPTSGGVTFSLSNSINRRIASILQRHLKPGARVVSHRFDMGDWQPEADVRLEATHGYLWTIREPQK